MDVASGVTLKWFQNINIKPNIRIFLIILIHLDEFSEILFKKIFRLDQRLNPDPALQSGTLTITLECLLCSCEAVIESYSCMILSNLSYSSNWTKISSF